MTAAITVIDRTGVAPVLDAMGLSRATFYRHRAGEVPSGAPRRTPARALSEVERQHVLDRLNSEEFVDLAPAEVLATLLDRDEYLCSERTLYRILAANAPVRDRRNQRRHPTYVKPELVATAPNQVWTWDITKLKTFEKWRYLYLYVVLDLFSRYVVGWMIAEAETAALAKRLIAESVDNQRIAASALTVHADRGSQMTAQCVSQMFATLGITRTHSRPHVPNDNPFSESQFKTVKYHPTFPERFAGHDHGLAFARPFFTWYNDAHHHSALGYLTPAVVHYGDAERVLVARERTMLDAYHRHPERFVNGPPRLPRPPREVWINKPRTDATEPEGDRH